jgi:hyperosmotically inducible protein
MSGSASPAGIEVGKGRSTMVKMPIAVSVLIVACAGCSRTDEEHRAEVARATPAAVVVSPAAGLSPAAAPAPRVDAPRVATEPGGQRLSAPPAEAARAVPPDNTGRNIRDRDGSTLTPEDQAENEADRTVTQRVRQALLSNESLSTNAKNAKVITTGGVVTLRGPVNSVEEKAAVAAAARQAAGVTRVEDQLEVVTR